MKKIVDVYGRELNVNEETQKLYNFCNKKRRITYSAEIMENGIGTGSWTEYEEKGNVNNIEDKLQTWNNSIKFAYSISVCFKASENDPDKKIWNKFVEYTKKHKDEIFTKHGDFKKRYSINSEKIVKEFL